MTEEKEDKYKISVGDAVCLAKQPTFFGEICYEPIIRMSDGSWKHENADKKTYDHEATGVLEKEKNMPKEKERKKMSIKEFREFGFLQEINRQFLHPLGLALEVTIEDDGEEKLSGVWDYRDDPEGIYYGLKESDEKRKADFRDKFFRVNHLLVEKLGVRKKILGFGIEPIDGK